MKYTVSYYIHGHIDIPVEADTVEEAIENADVLFDEYDLNEMVYGDSGINCIYDDKLNEVYFD